MVIPTTGLSFRSPSHRVHKGLASGLGGENTATTVPRYSPSTSTTRTRPAGCPVLSLTVCHSPAGVGASPQAGPLPARTSTKRRLENAERTKSVEKRVGHVDMPVEDAPRGAHERGALDHRRRSRSVGDQVHLDVTRGMLDAEHAAGKSLGLDVAARDGSGKHPGGAPGERAGHPTRAGAGVRRGAAPWDAPALHRAPEHARVRPHPAPCLPPS